MPKRKSSLGRSTKGAKRKKETRTNEDDNSYSQRLQKEKNWRTIERENELQSIMMIEKLQIDIRKN